TSLNLVDSYKIIDIEDWTCDKLVEHYREKSEKKNWCYILDNIKKDLTNVANSKSEFDEKQRNMAQKILDHWKFSISSASWELIVPEADLAHSYETLSSTLERKLQNFCFIFCSQSLEVHLGFIETIEKMGNVDQIINRSRQEPTIQHVYDLPTLTIQDFTSFPTP
ncbi:2463_t:CDS:2, partial [Dentiscutata erythropus]